MIDRDLEKLADDLAVRLVNVLPTVGVLDTRGRGLKIPCQLLQNYDAHYGVTGTHPPFDMRLEIVTDKQDESLSVILYDAQGTRLGMVKFKLDVIHRACG